MGASVPVEPYQQQEQQQKKKKTAVLSKRLCRGAGVECMCLSEHDLVSGGSSIVQCGLVQVD